MAFSSAPEKDTYSSVRLPLVAQLDLLPAYSSFSNMLSGMSNVLPFKAEEEEFGETRLGIKAKTVVSGGYICRGFYVWEKSAGTVYMYAVVSDGGTSYVYTSPDGTTWTNVLTLNNNAATPVRFAEFITSSNVKSLIMVDGIEGYVFTTNAAGVEITDVDFPSPHLPWPVVIDGYLFLAKKDTGDIYNSNLDDPSTWTAGDFISSELYPDDLQAILKVNNYLLAVGTQGCEYFYDAANATGTPLARQEGGSLPFGTVFPNTIAATKDTVVFLANNNDGSSVFKIIDGFKNAEFPSTAVLRAISTQLVSGTISASGMRAGLIRQNGELFYLLNFSGTSTGSATTDTVITDLKQKKWMRFTSDLGNAGAASGLYNYPVYFTSQGTSTNPNTYVAGQHGGAVFAGYLDPSAGVDTINGGTNTYSIYQKIITAPQNFGTMNRKFMYRLGVMSSDANTSISVSYSDDNSVTWSTARTIGGTQTGPSSTEFPFLTQLGSFRNRAFALTSTYKIRWNAIECDINKGQQ